MNTTYQFNSIFADFYHDHNGILEYVGNSSIVFGTLKTIVDTVTPQLSSFSCKDLEGIKIGDYGIIRDETGNRVFRIIGIKREKDSETMELSVGIGVDMLSYKYICEAASDPLNAYKSPAYVKINDLVTVFNHDISELNRVGRIGLPYTFKGNSGSVTVEFGQTGAKTFSEILREKMRTDALSVQFDIVNCGSGEYIDSTSYKVEVQINRETTETIDLNLDDTSVFETYKVDVSTMQYNVLVFGVVGRSGNVLRVDIDGKIQEPFKSDLTINDDYDKKAILPAIIERIIVDPKSSNATSYESATAKLLEQYYSSNIEAVVKLDNKKIDVSNLDKLFSYKFNIWKNGECFKTICTRYEYYNDGFVTLKFGNARGRLTEKIQKIINK